MNSLKQELDFLGDPRGGAEDDSPSPLPLPRAILGKNNGRDEDDDRDHSDDDLVLGAPSSTLLSGSSAPLSRWQRSSC